MDSVQIIKYESLVLDEVVNLITDSMRLSGQAN